MTTAAKLKRYVDGRIASLEANFNTCINATYSDILAAKLEELYNLRSFLLKEEINKLRRETKVIEKQIASLDSVGAKE